MINVKKKQKSSSYANGFNSCLDKARDIEKKVATTLVDVFGGSVTFTEGKCSWDINYTDSDGETLRVEVKDDAKSQETGNLFIETENPKGLSGLALSHKDRVDYAAIVSCGEVLLVKLADLMKLADSDGRDIQSRNGANGNSSGWYGAGVLLKIMQVRAIAEHILTLS